MRFVIQRVTKARVEADGAVTGEIGRGLLVLVGVGGGDTREVADRMLKKLVGLRIFQDDAGKTNLSLADVGGALLLVSQFTLYADCRKGYRPGFSPAAPPQLANELYEYLLEQAARSVPVVRRGIFGADMKVSLENDGPFTIILDSSEMWGNRG